MGIFPNIKKIPLYFYSLTSSAASHAQRIVTYPQPLVGSFSPSSSPIPRFHFQSIPSLQFFPFVHSLNFRLPKTSFFRTIRAFTFGTTFRSSPYPPRSILSFVTLNTPSLPSHPFPSQPLPRPTTSPYYHAHRPVTHKSLGNFLLPLHPAKLTFAIFVSTLTLKPYTTVFSPAAI